MLHIKNNNDRNKLVFNEFPAFFDDVLTREFFYKSKRNAFNTLPSVNIKETEKAFELDLAAPGLDKKNFKIELTEDKITISASKEVNSEEKTEGEAFSKREFNYQSFSRSFILPEKLIDKDSINASYDNGILKVMLPKKESRAADQNKEIQIS